MQEKDDNQKQLSLNDPGEARSDGQVMRLLPTADEAPHGVTATTTYHQ